MARAKVHPKTAQTLARHSTITLTMDRYTHTVVEDRSAALEALPDLSAPPSTQEAQATGTDDESVVASCLAPKGREHAISRGATRRNEAQRGSGHAFRR